MSPPGEAPKPPEPPEPWEPREPSGEQPLRDSISRFDRARRRWREDEPRLLTVAMSVMGIGWMVVLPTLAAMALGRFIDARLHTGVTFAAALGALGLAFGCTSAWRWVRK
jgi:ATP synthase protein I